MTFVNIYIMQDLLAHFNQIFPFQVVVSDKMKNLRRLEAQRNELNAKGRKNYAVVNLKNQKIF